MEEVDEEAIAMTLPEGSKDARYGVARLRRACGFLDFRFQRRTVLSREQEMNLSSPGWTARAVTGAVWPEK